MTILSTETATTTAEVVHVTRGQVVARRVHEVETVNGVVTLDEVTWRVQNRGASTWKVPRKALEANLEEEYRDALA